MQFSNFRMHCRFQMLQTKSNDCTLFTFCWILNSFQHGRKEEKLHYMIEKSSSEKTRGKWWKHITNQQGPQYRQENY